MSCAGCKGIGTIFMDNKKAVQLEGNELVVEQLVDGETEQWWFELARIKCRYCIQCGKELVEELEE